VPLFDPDIGQEFIERFAPGVGFHGLDALGQGLFLLSQQGAGLDQFLSLFCGHRLHARLHHDERQHP
jgi:hypothetical protein